MVTADSREDTSRIQIWTQGAESEPERGNSELMSETVTKSAAGLIAGMVYRG